MAVRSLENAFSVQISFDRRNIQRQVEAAAEAAANRTLERMAALAVEETENIIRKEFVNDRSGRRRKGRSQHLLGSIKSKIDGQGRDRRLIIYSTADPKKVGALEHGTETPYRIHPSDAEEGFLYFPSNLAQRPVPVGPARRAPTGKRQGAYVPYNRPKKSASFGRDQLLTKAAGVKHPAFKGKHFMRRGGERAFQKVNGANE